MNVLDFLTLISYIALNVDIFFQIRKIHKTRSSRDLSLLGLIIRYVAILIILFKFISLVDTYLIIGQGLILVMFTIYFIYAVSYRNKIN